MKRRYRRKTAKACPECGPATNLVVRTNERTKTQFLGCENFPECKHTEEIPTDMAMELMGAKRLL